MPHARPPGGSTRPAPRSRGGSTVSAVTSPTKPGAQGVPLAPLMKRLFLTILAALFTAAGHATPPAAGMVRVPPSDPDLAVTGARYARLSDEGLEFLRFAPELYEMRFNQLKAAAVRARTTSGVRLSLKTDAARVVLHFVFRPGDENRGSQFGIIRDGQWLCEVSIPGNKAEHALELSNPASGRETLFEVVLPSWSNPILAGIDLPEGARLLPVTAKKKKVYVALGDSISHGTGQRSASFQTWPFLLAEKLDLELWNLAVGGAQVSPPIAGLLKDWPRVDLVTLLVGYNDWNTGAPCDRYRADLDELIGVVRRTHPEARIVCIRPLHTRSVAPKHGDATLDSFRAAVTFVVEARVAAGDKNLFVLNGEGFTSDENLSASADPVHLSISGAAAFADELSTRISALK